MATEEFKHKIITFKKKDEREDKQLDKQEIVKQHLKGRMTFCDTQSLQDQDKTPRDFDQSRVGLDVNLYDLPLISGEFTDAEIKSLGADNNVELIEDDLIAYAVVTPGISNEQSARMRMSLQAEDTQLSAGELLPWGVDRIDAERAWEVTRGAGIRVAVLDTGIDHLHQDLTSNFHGGVSFVPGEDFSDGNGHGTHVAGIIGARQNGVGVVGVAPNCDLFSVKILNRTGNGRYSWIISGILWSVRNRMDIINMSLGGLGHVQALQNACDYALRNNVVVIAAAGNRVSKDNTVRYPARYDSVVAVSAVNESGDFANFSCQGEQVDLSAPGERILSTLPGNRYGRHNGTSMAAPHVAGVAALTISSHRLTDAETIRQILFSCADNLGIPGRDDMFGHGLVDAEQSAFLRVLH